MTATPWFGIAMETISVGNEKSLCRPIEPVPHSCLTNEARQQLEAAHPFAGYAQPGDPPRIFFRFERQPTPPFVMCEGGGGVFGAGLIITVLQPPTGAAASACICGGTDVLDALASGRFIALLVHRSRLAAAYQIQLAGPGAVALAEEWNDVAEALRQRFCEVPLGYEVKDKRLVVHELEAVLVRELFALYLEHRSALFTRPFSDINQRIALLRAKSQTLGRTSDARLPRLLSGELSVAQAEQAVEATA